MLYWWQTLFKAILLYFHHDNIYNNSYGRSILFMIHLRHEDIHFGKMSFITVPCYRFDRKDIISYFSKILIFRKKNIFTNFGLFQYALFIWFFVICPKFIFSFKLIHQIRNLMFSEFKVLIVAPMCFIFSLNLLSCMQMFNLMFELSSRMNDDDSIVENVQ